MKMDKSILQQLIGQRIASFRIVPSEDSRYVENGMKEFVVHSIVLEDCTVLTFSGCPDSEDDSTSTSFVQMTLEEFTGKHPEWTEEVEI